MINSYKMLKTWIVARTSSTERGATMVEYALMVALIAIVVALAAFALGNAIGDRFTDSSKCVQTPGGADCAP
ncbi:MAG: Flp family type IVb pilin [Actinomycetota bacterium]|nr:Flp family type IVb pilin [Actinomycetota bacterium]